MAKKRANGDWLTAVEDLTLELAPAAFRFVAWCAALGALWFVSARAHSWVTVAALYVLIALWSSYVMISTKRWVDEKLPQRFRFGLWGLAALVPTALLALAIGRAAIVISADVTGANLTESERQFFFLPKAEKDRLTEAIRFEEKSGARPPFPETVVAGIAEGVAIIPGHDNSAQIGVAIRNGKGELQTGVLAANLRDHTAAAVAALIESAVASRKPVVATASYQVAWTKKAIGTAKQPKPYLAIHRLDIEGYSFRFPCYWVPPAKRD